MFLNLKELRMDNILQIFHRLLDQNTVSNTEEKQHFTKRVQQNKSMK